MFPSREEAEEAYRLAVEARDGKGKAEDVRKERTDKVKAEDVMEEGGGQVKVEHVVEEVVNKATAAGWRKERTSRYRGKPEA